MFIVLSTEDLSRDDHTVVLTLQWEHEGHGLWRHPMSSHGFPALPRLHETRTYIKTDNTQDLFTSDIRIFCHSVPRTSQFPYAKHRDGGGVSVCCDDVLK